MALAILVAPLVTIGLWIVNVVAAVLAEVPALARGPSDKAVVWNIPRERISATGQ